MQNEFLRKITPTFDVGKQGYAIGLLLRARNFFAISTLVKGPATHQPPLRLLPLLLADQLPFWRLPQGLPSCPFYVWLHRGPFRLEVAAPSTQALGAVARGLWSPSSGNSMTPSSTLPIATSPLASLLLAAAAGTAPCLTQTSLSRGQPEGKRAKMLGST